MIPEQVRGLELAEKFYIEVVSSILEEKFPRLRHAAALLGPGSEVSSSSSSWMPAITTNLLVRSAAR
ncbi:MAG: hypothetical protein ACTSU5_11225 [Promethearchaeota archaeon]